MVKSASQRAYLQYRWIELWVRVAIAIVVLVGGLTVPASFLVVRVGVSNGCVVLRKLFSSKTVLREEVARVEVDPPVSDVDAGISWSERTGFIRVSFLDGRPPIYDTNVTPGLKLRIARALDPNRFSGEPLEGA